jgi:hypothetical protein
MENVVNAAGQLQNLKVVGLRTYLLNTWIGSEERIVKLPAWMLYLDVFCPKTISCN